MIIIKGKVEGNNATRDVNIAEPLKHLSNFSRALDIPLANCDIYLILTWSQNYELTSKWIREAVADDNLILEINASINATFKIKDSKLYVPVITLLTQDDNRLIKQLKTGLKKKKTHLNGIK